MSMEKTCCFIGTITPRYHYIYNTNVLQDVKDIVDFEKYILENYPIYLQDNLLIKNIDDDIKNHIWIRIGHVDLNSFDNKIRKISEQFLPKKKKFSIIYSAYKLSKNNNSTIDEELEKYYNDVDHYFLKDLAYYMTLTQYALI